MFEDQFSLVWLNYWALKAPFVSQGFFFIPVEAFAYHLCSSWFAYHSFIPLRHHEWEEDIRVFTTVPRQESDDGKGSMGSIKKGYT